MPILCFLAAPSSVDASRIIEYTDRLVDGAADFGFCIEFISSSVWIALFTVSAGYNINAPAAPAAPQPQHQDHYNFKLLVFVGK